MVEEIALPVGENSNQNTERVLKRILIVDDSEVIRQRLSSLISDTEGVELIGEAVDTQSAIRLWQSTNPDIVILDLRIPGDGGISVLRELKRQSPETVVAVLILWTGLRTRRWEGILLIAIYGLYLLWVIP